MSANFTGLEIGDLVYLVWPNSGRQFRASLDSVIFVVKDVRYSYLYRRYRVEISKLPCLDVDVWFDVQDLEKVKDNDSTDTGTSHSSE